MSISVTTMEAFQSTLDEAGNKLIVISFHANWSEPCEWIAPLVEEIAVDHKEELVVVRADLDDIEELVVKYNVEFTPHFVFERQGKYLDSFSGSEEEKLKQFVAKYLIQENCNSVSIAVPSVAEFESKLAEAGDKIVVIVFHATWCDACTRVAPILEEIASKHKDELVVIKVDVDEVDELVTTYKVKVMPTFVFKLKGEQIDTLVGLDEEKLSGLIEMHLSQK